MDISSGFISGLQIIGTVSNLFYCFVGVFIGTLVGVLPGIGPIGAMAMLLPLTFGLSPASAIIMLAGMYYGAQYGGSTTSILVNIPGESASVVTCLDGYQMAKQGRAGPALGISAIGSFVGGTFSVVGLMFFAYSLAQAALRFGPPEYFSLVCLSMTVLIYIARGSVPKAVLMIFLGMVIRTIGTDLISGEQRFTFGSLTLQDGIGLVPLAMGLFGISEIIRNIESPMERLIYESKIKNLFPTLGDWKRSIGPIIRGSFLGFFLGVLPGGGGIISSFTSYTIEKKISRRQEEFGKGAIEGVAGPETANNAGAGGSFVPLFALGIPSNTVIAVLMGALMIHGVVPGPRFISEHPDIFWGTVASMYVGNVMLLILNLPLIGLWVKVLKIPYRILMPLILLFCLIGVYSINNNVMEVILMALFGMVGYILKKFHYEPAPLLLAFVLEPLLETNFRQSLIMSNGEFSIFLQRPISAAAWIATFLVLISACFSYYRKTKTKIVTEE
ncbi:MAG: tripartite tricarboxylate transporter permease [Thermodesulfobacteriota bacterium]